MYSIKTQVSMSKIRLGVIRMSGAFYTAVQLAKHESCVRNKMHLTQPAWIIFACQHLPLRVT